ncbi:MAG: hypothetical protein ACYC4T_08665 [Melioribacteraceae bacterium]
MKKLLLSLAFITVILLISISCSENSEQPSSPSPSSNPLALSKDNGTTNGNAQNGKFGVIGKLFDKHEADVLFGKVISSVQISTDDLKNAVAKGKDYIFFTIKNNRVVVTNEKKESLTEDRDELEKDEQIYSFSKSMILELLKAKKSSLNLAKSAADAVAVELRDGVLTLSYADATLEFALPCPPTCPN